jgi:GT2 family glycosyltransferase
VKLPVERFNYSAANNFGARQTDAEFLCLLNDDVAPIASGWLEAMLGHFADPLVAAVGAKLLYENKTVQHGGIIVGLAGLAEHVNRGLPREAGGYAHRAVLNQEMSAVTGACLLTRRSAYEETGGMDEGFPIAFNDVDFCLKLRRAGHRIVFCAEAELIHYESLSLGHHFSGERAGLEREEVRRMRQRWASVVAEDPFHNPNLSLARGQEWRLAFPPRLRKSSLLGG